MQAAANQAIGDRRIIRADGTEQALEPTRNTREIARRIGADTLDSVNLRHLGAPLQVMFVDDNGHAKGSPVNAKATALYRANCRPGTAHVIRGDVAIVFDRDFA